MICRNDCFVNYAQISRKEDNNKNNLQYARQIYVTSIKTNPHKASRCLLIILTLT